MLRAVGWASLAGCGVRGIEGSLEVPEQEVSINNIHASRLVLGDGGVSWLDTASLPEFHAEGLQGTGQVVGLGDTGIDVKSCSFADPDEEVPYERVSFTHRKIAGYFSVHGDRLDGPDGHGTHIGGTMVSRASSLQLHGNGVAPSARVAVVDLEDSGKPGQYAVPDHDIGRAYFDLLRVAGVSVVCSPWSYKAHQNLEYQIDRYAWQHPEFLAIFPSGNTFGAGDRPPHSPCRAKNALCVGASYNVRESYLSEPAFLHIALRGADACPSGNTEACHFEIEALPAFFGSTKPLDMQECQAVASLCLETEAACPECAFDAASLSAVASEPVKAAEPATACEALMASMTGSVCLVHRGGCSFAQKAKRCEEAGALGVIVVNYPGGAKTLMVLGADDADVALPVVLVSHADAARYPLTGRQVTFPVVTAEVSPHVVVPYSAFGPLPDGRVKPELVFPGDNVYSTARGADCGLRQMSGTSQSCGMAAGTAALVREYFMRFAASTARFKEPTAATLKAALVAAAALGPGHDGRVVRDQAGFGLPGLARVLPFTSDASNAPALVAVQSSIQASTRQRFLFNVVLGSASAADLATVVLAWTDPPAKSGSLVHDLDLLVACGADGWKTRFGNDRLDAADSVNTLEKIVLGGVNSGVCMVSVSAKPGTAKQAFSLLVSGRLALRSSGYISAAHSFCGEHGSSRAIDDNGAHGCKCERPWVGPFCDQSAAVVDPSNQPTALSIMPLQWAVAHVSLCGEGLYEFAAENADGEPIDVVVSARVGADLWRSPSHALGSSATWQEDGLLFAVGGSASSADIGVRVPAGEEGAELLNIAAFSYRRDGQASLRIRVLQAPGSCGPVATPNLRGMGEEGAGAGLVLYLTLGFAVPALLALLCVGLRTCAKRQHQVQQEPTAAPPVSEAGHGRASKGLA